jgi:hypothetical protein
VGPCYSSSVTIQNVQHGWAIIEVRSKLRETHFSSFTRRTLLTAENCPCGNHTLSSSEEVGRVISITRWCFSKGIQWSKTCPWAHGLLWLGGWQFSHLERRATFTMLWEGQSLRQPLLNARHPLILIFYPWEKQNSNW